MTLEIIISILQVSLLLSGVIAFSYSIISQHNHNKSRKSLNEEINQLLARQEDEIRRISLSAMREGKKVKIKSHEFNFSMISKLYYDSDINRSVHIFSELHLSEDWEII